jgi:Rad3-related DNA helicase
MEEVKYQERILKAFQYLGYVPRPFQIPAVSDILQGFLDSGRRNVVLSAPTGAGKSLIAIVVAEVLHGILSEQAAARDEKFTELKSLSLTGTNILAEQYANSFGENPNFLAVRGAAAYPCNYHSKPGKDADAESCTFRSNKDKSLCNGCLYNTHKKIRNLTQHVTTNYAMFFTSQLSGSASNPVLRPRLLTIWDESHLVNDIFCEHVGIRFTEKIFERMIGDVKTYFDSTFAIKMTKSFNAIIADLRNVDSTTYRGFLQTVYANIKLIIKELVGNIEVLETQREISDLEPEQEVSLLAQTKSLKTYQNHYTKIENFYQYEYDHVFDNKDGEYVIKPIFMSNSKTSVFTPVGLEKDKPYYNLFMSATLSDTYFKTVFGLEDIAFIKLKPVFPPDRKMVLTDYATHSLTYNSLKSADTVKNLAGDINEIFGRMIKMGENGLIQTPSFHLQNDLMKYIDQNVYTLIVHDQREGLAPALKRFKETKVPAILISPSAFEGIDLRDDECRFQIIVKTPFASLGDKRIAHISQNFPRIYEEIAIMKLIQGLGRSVRGPEDYAAMFLLDASSFRLLNGPTNIWRDEFQLS